MARPAPASARAANIVAFLTAHAGRGFTISELVDHLGMNISSAHATLAVLCDLGFTLRDPQHRTYVLGPALAVTGFAALEQHPAIEAAISEAESSQSNSMQKSESPPSPAGTSYSLPEGAHSLSRRASVTRRPLAALGSHRGGIHGMGRPSDGPSLVGARFHKSASPRLLPTRLGEHSLSRFQRPAALNHPQLGGRCHSQNARAAY